MRKRWLRPAVTPEFMGVVGGGADWADVAIPDSDFSFAPTIQKKGAAYRVAPDFDLLTYANITVSKTYYVDFARPDDSGDGLTWATAFKSFLTGLSQADVDLLYVKTGRYNSTRSWAAYDLNRSVAIIADGGPVYLTNDLRTGSIEPFTASGSHYVGNVLSGKIIGSVWDHSALDALGDDSQLTLVSSEAEVDATPGSWWQSGATMYVHLADNRAPDANSRFYQDASGQVYHAKNNQTLYMDGINVEGVTAAGFLAYFANATSTGGNRLYAKNCTFKFSAGIYASLRVAGCTEVILQNCVVSANKTEDGLNYHALNTIVPNIVEIDCEVRGIGVDSTNQASTSHDGAKIVRVNGVYHHTTGQVIADAGNGKQWLLGCELHNTDSGIGFYTEGTAWLDGVYTHDIATYDLQNTVGSTIYTRNCRLGKGTNDIAGTLAAY